MLSSRPTVALGLTSLLLIASAGHAQDTITQPSPAVVNSRPNAAPGDNNPAGGHSLDPAAKALIEKARDVITNATTIQYEIFTPQVGLMGGDRAPRDVRAKVAMKRSEPGPGWAQRLTGSGVPAKDQPAIEFDVLWDRSQFSWVDHKTKTVFTRPFNQARSFGSLMMINGLRNRVITSDRPMSELLVYPSMALDGEEVVDGVPCDIVVAGTSLEGQGNRVRIWIARTDSFPRRIQTIIDSKLINASDTIELTGVRLNETLAEGLIPIAVPEGYAVDRLEPAPPPPPPVTDRARVPEFELATLEGAKVTKESLAGKVAVVQFFGTWSNPAKRSHAEFAALAEKYREKGVQFYLAAVREQSADSVREYVNEAAIKLPVLLDADTLAEQINVQSVPTAVVIGADGSNVRMISNFLPESTMKQVAEGVDIALNEAEAKKNATATPASPAPAPAATPDAAQPATPPAADQPR